MEPISSRYYEYLQKTGGGDPTPNLTRVDGTLKGPGWLGPIPSKDGYMTELSITTDVNGRPTNIPAIVPTLTKDEINYLAEGGGITRPIAEKAIEHARLQLAKGQSPFFGTRDWPISTNTGRPELSPDQQFNQHVQGLKTIGQNLSDWEEQAIGTYGRAPGWQMGMVNAPNIQQSLSPATLQAARDARAKLYAVWKGDIQNKRTLATNPVLDRMLAGVQPGKRSMKSMLNEYHDQVQRLTSIPDSIVSSIKAASLVGKKEARSLSGSWDPAVRQVSTALNRDKGAVTHEIAGHAATQWAKDLFMKVAKDETKAASFKELPAPMRQTLLKLKVLEDFDEPLFKMMDLGNSPQAARARKFYNDNYHIWPSEKFSFSIEAAVPKKAQELGRRLTSQEYLETVDDAANKGLVYMRRHFPDKFNTLMQSISKYEKAFPEL